MAARLRQRRARPQRGQRPRARPSCRAPRIPMVPRIASPLSRGSMPPAPLRFYRLHALDVCYCSQLQLSGPLRSPTTVPCDEGIADHRGAGGPADRRGTCSPGKPRRHPRLALAARRYPPCTGRWCPPGPPLSSVPGLPRVDVLHEPRTHRARPRRRPPGSLPAPPPPLPPAV